MKTMWENKFFTYMFGLILCFSFVQIPSSCVDVISPASFCQKQCPVLDSLTGF